MDCGDLGTVEHTIIQEKTGTQLDDQITYSCEEGYGLISGDLTRICLHNAVWSGSQPTCISMYWIFFLTKVTKSYKNQFFVEYFRHYQNERIFWLGYKDAGTPAAANECSSTKF